MAFNEGFIRSRKPRSEEDRVARSVSRTLVEGLQEREIREDSAYIDHYLPLVKKLIEQTLQAKESNPGLTSRSFRG